MCGTHGLEDVCFSILTHTRPISTSPQTIRSNRFPCAVLWWAQLNEVEEIEDFELPLATAFIACTLIIPPAFCMADQRVEVFCKKVELATLFPNASKVFDAQFDGECGSVS